MTEDDRKTFVLRQIAFWVLSVALLLATFTTALAPINSYDFWWHLKTGEYIVATGAIPTVDPLTYTATADDPAEPGRPAFILNQYWLAQIIYSMVNGIAGLKGIIALRASLFAAMSAAAVWLAWRERRSFYGFIALIPFLLAIRVALEDSDRPQNFAFLLVFLMVVLIEASVRNGWYRLPLLCAPVTLFLANLHAGFIVGWLVVMIYAGCAYFEERLLPFRRTLVLTGVLTSVAGLVNPNGWNPLVKMFSLYSSTAVQETAEFRSPLSIISYVATNPGWLAYWSLIVLSFAVIAFLVSRRFWSSAILLTGFAAVTLVSMRYIGFFLPVAALFLALALNAWFANIKSRMVEGATWLLCLTAFVLIVSFPWHENRFGIRSTLLPGYFPTAAADYLEKNAPQGKIYNFLAWGGYLEYRLWPKYQFFADTRVLFTESLRNSQEILEDTDHGRKVTEQYGINVVVLPSIDIYTGEIFPLVRRLCADNTWSLLYYDDDALIFARKTSDIQVSYKKMAYYQILRQLTTWRPLFPWASGYDKSYAEISNRLRMDQ